MEAAVLEFILTLKNFPYSQNSHPVISPHQFPLSSFHITFLSHLILSLFYLNLSYPIPSLSHLILSYLIPSIFYFILSYPVPLLLFYYSNIMISCRRNSLSYPLLSALALLLINYCKMQANQRRADN